MIQHGYDSYQDPRLACPPERHEPDEGRTCDACRFYKDVERSQNGLTEYVGTCVVEVFRATALPGLLQAEVYEADPDDEGCTDWEPRRC